MLYRVLGLLIAVCLMVTGYKCLEVNTFGPMLTGYFLVIVGSILGSVIIYVTLEQIMNVYPFNDLEDDDEDRL